MLDKYITPDDHEECPECGGMVNVYGDKWEGHKECEDCDYEYHWDNI